MGTNRISDQNIFLIVTEMCGYELEVTIYCDIPLTDTS